MDNSKLIKTANTLDKVIKIIGGLTKAFAIVCAVFALLVIIFGSRMFVPGSLTLELDYITIHLSEKFQAVTGYVKLFAIVGLAVGCVLCLLAWDGTVLLRRILAPMKEGRPFEESVSADLCRGGWLVVIGGAAAQVLGIAERLFLLRAYPVEAVFSSEAIAKLEYTFVFDFSFLLMAAALFFLSYVFRYGQSLQQLSDETL